MRMVRMIRGVECRRPDRRMFDINKFLYKLRDRSMYTSIFKSKAKRKTSATVTEIFEGMNMAFTGASRVLSRPGGRLSCRSWFEQRIRRRPSEALVGASVVGSIKDVSK